MARVVSANSRASYEMVKLSPAAGRAAAAGTASAARGVNRGAERAVAGGIGRIGPTDGGRRVKIP